MSEFNPYAFKARIEIETLNRATEHYMVSSRWFRYSTLTFGSSLIFQVAAYWWPVAELPAWVCIVTAVAMMTKALYEQRLGRTLQRSVER